MPRGKGTLEVKPSSSPFFQTTSSNIGRKIESVEWQAPEVWRPKAKPEKDGYFEFMFAKPTNEIGAGVPFSDSAISKSMRSSETDSQIATRKGEGLYVATTQPPSQVAPTKATIDEVLKSYEHRTKPENPVYTTTSNSIGFKKPDESTFSCDRLSISQGFSNSFGGVRYRHQGLNTGVSHSTVHPNLDPQFQ